MSGTVLGLILALVSAGLLLAFGIRRAKGLPGIRTIPSFELLRKKIGLAVEEGTRVHVSLGRGGLTSPQSAAAFAGLNMLRSVTDLASASDLPPVATAGDGTLAILAQDTLGVAKQEAEPGGPYDAARGLLTGLTPFSYAAGTLPVMRAEQVSVNILMGNLGIETGLLMDAAEQTDSFTLVASDNLPAQAILYASAHEPLIGEELFAAGAYMHSSPMHVASLRVQDILRWLIVLAVVIGVVLKLAGLL